MPFQVTSVRAPRAGILVWSLQEGAGYWPRAPLKVQDPDRCPAGERSCQGLHRPHGMWSEEAASAQVLPTCPTRHRAPKGSGCHPCSRGQWRMCRDDPRFPPPPATPRPRPPQPGRANTPPGEIVAPIQCSSANQQPSWESLSRGRRQLIVWGGLKPCAALSGQRGNLRAATQALS